MSNRIADKLKIPDISGILGHQAYLFITTGP